MWIKNKHTGVYICVSPAIAKHTINQQPAVYKDTQSQYCTCGTENHREKINCRSCGKTLNESKTV